jgi:hypothetical protein
VRQGRRYKFYTGDTGVSYRYFLEACRPVVRPEGQGRGSDYNFVVMADQHPPFTLRVFVANRALEAWRAAHGRELDANEKYAAAKMRLFRAFDEYEHLVEARLSLVVDETNLEDLLAPLDLV